MGWKTTKNPIDLMVELAGPTALSGAVGWAAWSLATPLAAVAGAVATWTIGYGLIRRVGSNRDRPLLAAFDPVLIHDAADGDSELLLDDPLADPPLNSRVVRLFADAEPTPGDLVARIADFLGDPVRTEPTTGEARRPTDDASEALHAALANIRASLR